MKFRRSAFRRILVYGAVVAAVITVYFLWANTGFMAQPKSFDGSTLDASFAKTLAFQLYGSVCLVAFIVFLRISPRDGDDSGPDPSVAQTRGSFTGFINQPWHMIFAVGPIWAVIGVAATFIWHASAQDSGNFGTVWGDFASSPLPAVVMLFAYWSAANLSFIWTSVAEAVSRHHRGLYVTILTFMWLFVIASSFFFGYGVPEMPTWIALVVCGFILLLTLPVLAGTHRWAVARISSYDHANPPQDRNFQDRQTAAARRQRARSDRAREGEPPYDLLAANEKLYLYHLSDLGREPQMIVLTNTRIVRASIVAPGRSFVLEQAEPGQLLGAETTHRGSEPVTLLYFRNRPDMELVCGDPGAASTFAGAVTSLAATGRLPHQEA
ncbi:hypothetical protein [Brevibacterium sp. 'Marine']|uniref:hypothetical protein n=1 Tax=Brevibacterium sp. 'Marine' TaxID=2725563 RepID=UPI00145DD184|nr:hypothetical protein [Brevibacterium sp. 'Marine']